MPLTVSDMNALMRQATHRVWHSRFARNVAIVASGAAGAKAITIAFAPIITRLYGPEAFGLLGTFMAILAIAGPLAALTYPIAIVLPKDDRDAMGLVRLSILISFGMALLASILLLIGGDWLTTTLGAESVNGYLLLIPVAMLFGAWLQIVHQWLIRKKQFGVIARFAVAHSLIVNSAKSGIGWFHPVGAVLIVLATLGNALHAALLFIGARNRHQAKPTEVHEGPRASLTKLAHRHRDFPFYRAPQQLLNTSTRSVPVLMLAALSGPMAAGFYTLANMVLTAPASIVSKAVGDVFYPRFTEADHANENRLRLLFGSTLMLAALGVIPFSIVFAFGPIIFSVLFGADWYVAGEYARWLSVLMFFHFINNPSVSALPVLNLQRILLIYAIASATVMIFGLFFGLYVLGSDVWGVALFSISGATFYILLIAWVFVVAYKRDNA